MKTGWLYVYTDMTIYDTLSVPCAKHVWCTSCCIKNFQIMYLLYCIDDYVCGVTANRHTHVCSLLWLCSHCCPGLQCGYERGLSWRDSDLQLHCQPGVSSGVDCWAFPSNQCSYPVYKYWHHWEKLDCNDIATLQCEDLNFVATLTNIANRMASVADMTSTLTFTATSRLNGTLVQCRGVTADATPMNSSTLKVAGVPMLFCFIAVLVSGCLATGT